VNEELADLTMDDGLDLMEDDNEVFQMFIQKREEESERRFWDSYARAGQDHWRVRD
jgi:hypothetical protein